MVYNVEYNVWVEHVFDCKFGHGGCWGNGALDIRESLRQSRNRFHGWSWWISIHWCIACLYGVQMTVSTAMLAITTPGMLRLLSATSTYTRDLHHNVI